VDVAAEGVEADVVVAEDSAVVEVADFAEAGAEVMAAHVPHLRDRRDVLPVQVIAAREAAEVEVRRADRDLQWELAREAIAPRSTAVPALAIVDLESDRAIGKGREADVLPSSLGSVPVSPTRETGLK